MKKRWLAALLALCLCVGLAVPAAASGYMEPPESQGYNEDAYQLSAAQKYGYDLHYTYDAEGRLIQVVNSDGKVTGTYTETYTYDANGRIDQVRRAYDAIDDPVMPIPAHTVVWDYVYDGSGRLTSIVLPEDGTDANVFTYDNQGRLVGELDEMGNPITYTYDANGRVATCDTDGFVLQYHYDSQGRLTEVTNDDEGYYERYTYDANGNHVRTENSDGETETFQYTAKKAPAEPTEEGFADVQSGAYYADAVAWAVEKNITSGTTATTFSPDAACTRAQVVTFLWRAMGSPAPKSQENPFTDVKSTDYFYSAALWAYETGVASGTSATTFSPNGVCSRAQAMTFLYRASGSPAASGTSAFTDVAASAYYAAAVRWAVGKNITSGTSATTFSPNAVCSRGQIVTFLYRALA